MLPCAVSILSLASLMPRDPVMVFQVISGFITNNTGFAMLGKLIAERLLAHIENPPFFLTRSNKFEHYFSLFHCLSSNNTASEQH